MDLIGMNFLFGLLLDSPVGVFLGMPPWLSPSEVLMGKLFLQISPLVISIISCLCLLMWLEGLLVLDSVFHELNPVRHEFLHLWRTFLACWILVRKIYCVWDSFHSCFGDVCLMASIAFYGWYYVTSRLSMCCPWLFIVWPIINYYSCTWWG